MKVLLSAYACEPNRGSEPEVGWRWLLEMSKHHDVVVMTRANNRPVIERYLKGRHDLLQGVKFIYHDLPKSFQRLKQISNIFNWYYVLWQFSAKKRVKFLIEREKVDLVHLVTFASFRYPVFLGGIGVPVIWGPVGGGEQAPWSLLFYKVRFPAILQEIIRNLATYFSSWCVGLVDPTRKTRGVALSSTPRTQLILKSRGVLSEQIPTIGTDRGELGTPREIIIDGPLKCIYVGRLVLLKGVHLLLDAFALMENRDAILTIVGDGELRPWLEKLAFKLGISNRVNFVGRVPKVELSKYYNEHDVLVAPSLYESGGYMVLEAFMQQRPAIVLDVGGLALSVDKSCGVKIPVESGKQVVAALAEAMDYYAENKEVIAEQGQAGYEKIMNQYLWETKGKQMDKVYRKVVSSRELKDRSEI